jgi:ABC-type phosphate transport system substrate-binding protein
MMKAALLLLLTATTAVTAQDSILAISGSGTTNPSKCYWAVMAELTALAKIPVHLTYRAVGSTTGQIEFVNNNEAIPAADFGSGDLPLTKDRFDGLTGATMEMMHLPIIVGAVSFFHNVPGVVGLNMTGEILARIYTYDITDWSHADIKKINPHMVLADAADTTVMMTKRAKGSSSTAAATEVSIHSRREVEDISIAKETFTHSHPPLFMHSCIHY